MSDPIGRISGSNVSNVIENEIDINNDAAKTQGNLGPKRAPNPSEGNSEISFKGGVVYNHAPIPENYKAAIESIRQVDLLGLTKKSFFSKIFKNNILKYKKIIFLVIAKNDLFSRPHSYC
ncbi:MAG: hypothetical protein J6Z28_04310 [Succinivibrio sp.]|nr:hypothetical protein [Succinivibrio sp.]